MSTVPKRRRRNRTESSSPQPVHYIDLTADSPMPVARQTRGRVSQSDEPTCNETTNTNSRQSVQLLETIVIDSTDPPPREAPTRRIGRPKKRPAAAAAAAATTAPTTAAADEGLIIDVDSTVVDDVPDKTIPRINDSVDGSPTVLTCPVCFEDLRASRKPMSTKCGHIYCEECLLATLNTQKKCPKCKGPITRKSCHRIYF